MRAIFFTILFFASFCNYSQINTPRTSPASKLNQVVGLTEIEVQYSRPSMRGRTIYGGVVPYGKIWRTGADNCTKISFSTDVVINEKLIKSGMYSIFSIPEKDSWKIMLYSDTDVWGVPKNWDEDKIIFQSDFKTIDLTGKSFIETFTIGFSNLTNNDVDMTFSWDDTTVFMKISVPTRKMVEQSIIDVINESPEPSDYYSAAVYYRQENIKLDVALEWINKAIEMYDNPRFYHLRQQSLIMAANSKFSDAIKTAKKSLDLSVKADNQDYIKMNKESILEWSKKL